VRVSYVMLRAAQALYAVRVRVRVRVS